MSGRQHEPWWDHGKFLGYPKEMRNFKVRLRRQKMQTVQALQQTGWLFFLREWLGEGDCRSRARRAKSLSCCSRRPHLLSNCVDLIVGSQVIRDLLWDEAMLPQHRPQLQAVRLQPSTLQPRIHIPFKKRLSSRVLALVPLVERVLDKSESQTFDARTAGHSERRVQCWIEGCRLRYSSSAKV
jgi:hypothetical protein